MKEKRITRKLFTLILALVMTVAMSGMAVSAEDETGNVASVDGTEYATLTEAITAAGSGGTVTLLADVTLNSTLDINKNLILDMDGHEIKYSNYPVISIKNDVEVTIENGTISAGTYYAVYATAGTVNLTDCTISAASGYAVYNGGADLTLNECAVTTPQFWTLYSQRFDISHRNYGKCDFQ